MSEQKTIIKTVPIPTDPRFVNITGKTFNYWTVLSYAGRSKGYYWNCLCKCGTVKRVNANTLKHNKTKSCGCFRDARNKACRTTHGESRKGFWSAEYRAFVQAKTRCNNPNYVEYANYGGRGVEFRFESFEEFLNEVGRRPSVIHSLDRTNPQGHYEKGNLRWATEKQQQRNKRSNILITWEGKTQTAIAWTEEKGINKFALYSRLKRGYCLNCALTVSGKPVFCSHKNECCAAILSRSIWALSFPPPVDII